jgi:hypothetical protein
MAELDEKTIGAVNSYLSNASGHDLAKLFSGHDLDQIKQKIINEDSTNLLAKIEVLPESKREWIVCNLIKSFSVATLCNIVRAIRGKCSIEVSHYSSSNKVTSVREDNGKIVVDYLGNDRDPWDDIVKPNKKRRGVEN